MNDQREILGDFGGAPERPIPQQEKIRAPEKGAYSGPERRVGSLAVPHNQLIRPETDIDIISAEIDAFMADLYGNDRYVEHNDSITATLEDNLLQSDDPNLDEDAVNAIKLTVVMHDFAEHTILDPERTAKKKNLSEEERDQIRENAFILINDLREKVEDKDLFDMAVIYSIDTSIWEKSFGQSIARGAASKIDTLIETKKITEDEAEIARAALFSNKDFLQKIEPEIIESTLKKCRLENLDLEKIESGAHKHNIAGLVVKAAEVLINIKNPPPNNPASTWRDCIEAVNVYAPALQMFGFKKLAAKLRGVALEWQYDDPDEIVKKQYEKSEQYFDEVKKMNHEIYDLWFGGVRTRRDSRIKSEGSGRRKQNSKKYLGKKVELPDGIGIAYVIEKDIPHSDLVDMAKEYTEHMTGYYEGSIKLEHTLEGEEEFEDIYEGKRKSGYQGVNIAFKFYPEDGPKEGVPFEVQFATKAQDRKHTYGRASHLFIEHDEAYNPEKHQPIFERFEDRAKNTIGNHPGSTVYSIAETVYRAPEYNFVFNKLFDAVKVDGQPLCLVPKGLSVEIKKVLESSEKQIGPEDEIVILHPDQITIDDFKNCIKIFDNDLITKKDSNGKKQYGVIHQAINTVEEHFAKEKRKDGNTGVIQGHLLTTALMAIMYATQSGIQWNRNDFEPSEFIETIAAVAILHDYVEDLTPKAKWTAEEAYQKGVTKEELFKDLKSRQDVRDKIIKGLRYKFGDVITDAVVVLTAPIHIEDERERRQYYAEQVTTNPIARMVKPLDRHGNHMTDLISLFSSYSSQEKWGDEVQNKLEDTLRYFAKTDRHLSKQFMAADMPVNYRAQHDLIWLLAERIGYEKKSKSAVK